MFKYILILIFFVLISNSKAEIKEKIIENLQNVENLEFKFEQNINGIFFIREHHVSQHDLLY